MQDHHDSETKFIIESCGRYI